MYQYDDLDRQIVRQRAAQFRDQLQRNLSGELSDDDFRPLRLQNGWYVQRHAPMLRVAVPYGELSSRQLRQLALIARTFDKGYGHFTTRQNIQFNWIPLSQAADVMDVLADVDMHGIQTSGNCIRNITSDALAGIGPDETVDPRPYCEILRQWSTLHPEFAFLPRKFKIAVTGASEDRAAIAWHDIGLALHRNAQGEVGFKVLVGGGMGRTPIIATPLREFLPWHDILTYIEAIVRVYNQFGRRDNAYKARIKILVKAEGEKFTQAVEAEYAALLQEPNGSAHRITDAELARVAAHFVWPAHIQTALTQDPALPSAPQAEQAAFTKWVQRNVHGHKLKGYRAVTLSLKRPGQAPGDVTDEQLERAAEMADQFSSGESRVTHDQNLLLPWVKVEDLYAVWKAAKAHTFAAPNIGLLTDMIACPGGDFCALANARSLPIAETLLQRYQDLDELEDIGEVDLHMSGCINSCGHHHSGHIGILGVDKDGLEWYQVSLGGSDGSVLSGEPKPGKVIGPSFAADEVPDVIEAVLVTYRDHRNSGEKFIDAVKRLGLEPFKHAANAVRSSTATPETEARKAQLWDAATHATAPTKDKDF